jgi:hypothetical protein
MRSADLPEPAATRQNSYRYRIGTGAAVPRIRRPSAKIGGRNVAATLYEKDPIFHRESPLLKNRRDATSNFKN